VETIDVGGVSDTDVKKDFLAKTNPTPCKKY
jgi:hypothetical protein